MDCDRKINLGEGVPLNSSGAAKIFLNTGKNKVTPDGTVIHLNTDKQDVGVHINTTLSVASSKKIKLLFVLNFLLSVICMVISCSIAFYYWNEMVSMRRQIDVLKDQFVIKSQEKIQPSPLVSVTDRNYVDIRQPRMDIGAKVEISPNTKRYFVDDLGEDMLLVDSSKKNPAIDKKMPIVELPLLQKETVIAHFNGALRDINLGTNSIIGPWVRDKEVSSKGSETKIVLNNDHVIIKENGLYLIYAQVTYLTHAPNCYLLFARQPGENPRHLSTCATGDDSTSRPLDKSHISCSVQTIARLYKDDTVNMAQREQNRTLSLRSGYTYFGFVKLSS